MVQVKIASKRLERIDEVAYVSLTALNVSQSLSNSQVDVTRHDDSRINQRFRHSDNSVTNIFIATVDAFTMKQSRVIMTMVMMMMERDGSEKE